MENGVYRGGCIIGSQHSNMVRSASIRTNVLSRVHNTLGFRCGVVVNGVYRGGSISTGLASNTNRSGARRIREKNVSGLSGVGFRLAEWCI